MGNFLYTIAILLLLVWAVGVFGYNIGGIIHILLVIAIVSILIRIIQGNRPM